MRRRDLSQRKRGALYITISLSLRVAQCKNFFVQFLRFRLGILFYLLMLKRNTQNKETTRIVKINISCQTFTVMHTLSFSHGPTFFVLQVWRDTFLSQTKFSISNLFSDGMPVTESLIYRKLQTVFKRSVLKGCRVRCFKLRVRSQLRSQRNACLNVYCDSVAQV